MIATPATPPTTPPTTTEVGATGAALLPESFAVAVEVADEEVEDPRPPIKPVPELVAVEYGEDDATSDEENGVDEVTGNEVDIDAEESSDEVEDASDDVRDVVVSDVVDELVDDCVED